MNSFPFETYKQTPNETEKKFLNSEASRERFNFLMLKKKLEKKKLDNKNLTRKFTRESLRVKISTRGRIRSTSSPFMTIEKRLTRKILQEQC